MGRFPKVNATITYNDSKRKAGKPKEIGRAKDGSPVREPGLGVAGTR
jgi:hypothetical protein